MSSAVCAVFLVYGMMIFALLRGIWFLCYTFVIYSKGCPKAGLRAKCGPRSNFIRPTASIIEYVSKSIEVTKQM